MMRYFRAALAVVLIASALGGCAKKGAAGPKGPPPLNVDVAMAVRRNIATYVSLNGQVAPMQVSTLAVQQSGPLVGVYANEGDHVSAGQLLAKVDDSTMRAQLAQNEALIAQASARAQSSALSVPITQQQTTSQVQSAQNTLQADEAALRNAQLTFNQNQQLFRQGYVSQSAFSQAQASYIAAQQKVQADQAALRTAQQNTLQTGVSSANAQADRAAIASAQAQANTLRTQIAQTALYAPFSGVITQRMMDPGAMAGPQSPVFQLSQVDYVWVNVNVPDEDLAYIHSGTPVTFNTDSLPGKGFHGRVSDVNAVPTQGTLSYRARLRQPNPSGILRGGMLVNVTIQQQSHPNAILVPRSAVAQTDKGNTVFVVQGNKAVQVPVRIGLQTETLSEVMAPQVRPGTRVITTRPDALQDGSVVAINGPGGGPPGAAAPAAGARHHRKGAQ